MTLHDTFDSAKRYFLSFLQVWALYAKSPVLLVHLPLKKRNGWGRNRTADTWIFSPLLCRLSYPAVMAPIVRRRGVFTMPQCRCRASAPLAAGQAGALGAAWRNL